MGVFDKQYPSTVEAADLMLDDLLGVLAAGGVEEAVVQRVSVAVSEAFTNAVVHGNRLDPGRTVHVRVSVNENEVHADIDDQGRNGLARIRGKTPAGELAESGRGVDLIRHLATRADFVERADGGLHVHLEFGRATRISKVQS
jgi:serine/threonine-protein kinase RsbW